MTLKTLEQRFTERSKEIYNRFAPSRDQLVSVKPDTRGVFGSRSRVKDDSRSVPTVSFVRDTRRITNFLKSPEGRLYIGKQLFLQTGNTFKETRIYNPLSNIQIPNQLLIKRNIGNDTTNRGLLQTTTVLTFSGKRSDPTIPTSTILGVPKFTTTPPDVPFELNRPEYNTYFDTKLTSYSPFLRIQPSRGERTQKKSTYWEATGALDVNNSAFYYGRVLKTTMLGRSSKAPVDKDITSGLNDNTRLLEKRSYFVQKFRDGGMRSDFYFNPSTYGATLDKDSYLYEPSLTPDAKTLVNSGTKSLPTAGYDPLNAKSKTTTFKQIVNGTNKFDYNSLIPSDEINKSTTPDIVNFAFQTNSVGSPLVKFRAFISTLKQSTKPEFQEQKYIGRTERFVSYSGAKRTASLSFNIVAFSKVELDVVWTKINYLTGLAFPLGVSSSGFMIPPLFKISIGGIYDAQPCYIENMDFDFIDDNITFDVDNEVSQFINVNMSIVLLEKRSRFYNSPFYAITQDLVDKP